MLAIQHPRMGPSQPPDGNRPFGFSINHDDSLFLEPPEPAPGEPLLTLEDDQALSNFFSQITSNQYSDVSFGEGLNFSDAWHGLPPQFMGTATSYGQHPPEPMSSSILDFGSANFHELFTFNPNLMTQMPPPPPQPQRHAPQPPLHSPIEQGTPADAAAVLTALQNGHTTRPNNMNHGGMASSSRMGPPPGPPSIQRQNYFKPERSSPTHLISPTVPTALGPLAEQRDDTLFADMAFGNPHPRGRQRPHQIPEDVRWGSDTSFGRGLSFIPTSERETGEALETERLKYIECLKISNSAANTRPSSPVANGESSTGNDRSAKLNGHGKAVRDPDAPPRKRRKSTVKEEVEEDDEDSGSALPKSARKRKSKVDLVATDEAFSTSGTSGKRRKSTVNGAKSARENLTDEQKRQNHILSEQKRRTLIKEGFEDLQEMVPNLKNGGYSKSAMLQLAGEWLDELIQGNAQLTG